MEENRLKDTTLLLFTEMFPFGLNSEQAFLSSEIKHLTKAFQKVIIFPQIIGDEQTTSGNFQVDNTLSRFLRKRTKFKMLIVALKQKLLYKEFLTKNFKYWNRYRLSRLFYFIAAEALVGKWFRNYIAVHKSLETSKVLVYTYWNNEITTGLLGCKSHLPYAKFISRAHGHDLFDMNHYDYLPCLRYNLQNLNRFFLVSQSAFNYIVNKYPEFFDKVILSHLGVKPAMRLTEKSKDGVLRVLSCSYVIKIKRIDLIILSLSEYSRKSHAKVEWTHFGDGYEMGRIQRIAKSNTSEWFSYTFRGFVPNNEILKFYEENPIDLFIHLSESEGGVPVAIQEAQAHGIPVIATAVGGIPEIVNSNVGVLLKDRPSQDDVVRAIRYGMSDRKKHINMRKNSLKNWKENYNEVKNYKIFLNKIFEIN